MTRRNIRLRPVRRTEVDLRRFAAALAALAHEAARQEQDKQRKNAAKAAGTKRNAA
jgi:hypothetical protein